LVTTVTVKINLLLDPLFGSFLPHGSVSELSYASRIAILFIAFAGQGPALTILASGSHTTRRPADSRFLALRVTMLLSVGAATVVAIAFSPVATLMLAHGALTSSKAATIGHLVQAYSVLIVVQSVVWSMESTMYAARRVWTVASVSIPALIANIGFSALFVSILGTYGRPLAVTLAMALYACLLMRVAGTSERRSFRSYISALPWLEAGKLIALISAICGALLIGGNAIRADRSLWAFISLIVAAITTLVYVMTWTRHAETHLANAATLHSLLPAPPSVLA
jgi:peptidoglycan biosynthesis protein MviN/MurJ (putative lipid II flippase)